MSYKLSITDSHIVLGIPEVTKLKDQLFSRGSKIRAVALDSSATVDGNAVVGWTSETLCSKLLEVLKNSGLSSLVIACEVPTARDLVHSVFSQCPDKLKAFTSLDPLQTWSAGDLRTDVSRGFTGLFLQPVVQHFHIYDKRAYGLYELCEELKLPVKIAFGLDDSPYSDLRYSNPIDLQPVARDFPGIPFIIHSFGRGYFRELLMVMKKCSNVYTDLSAANRYTTYESLSATLKDQIHHVGKVASPERILFGSGSGNPFGKYTMEFIDELLLLFSQYNPDINEAVFGATIRKLMDDIHLESAKRSPDSRLRLKRF